MKRQRRGQPADRCPDQHQPPHAFGRVQQGMKIERQPAFEQDNRNRDTDARPHQGANIAGRIKHAKNWPNQDARQKHQNNRRHPQPPRQPLRPHTQGPDQCECGNWRKLPVNQLNRHSLPLSVRSCQTRSAARVPVSQSGRSCRKYNRPRSTPDHGSIRPPPRLYAIVSVNNRGAT